MKTKKSRTNTVISAATPPAAPLRSKHLPRRRIVVISDVTNEELEQIMRVLGEPGESRTLMQ